MDFQEFSVQLGTEIRMIAVSSKIELEHLRRFRKLFKRYRMYNMNDAELREFLHNAALLVFLSCRYSLQFKNISGKQQSEVRRILELFLYLVESAGIYNRVIKIIRRIIDEAVDRFSSSTAIKELFRIYSVILDNVSQDNKKLVASKHHCFPALFEIVKNTDDIDTQAIILEVVLKFLTDCESNLLDETFIEIVAFVDVASINKSNIYQNIRMVLDKLNETSNMIFSINCSAIKMDGNRVFEFNGASNTQEVWLDFNLNQHKMSFFVCSDFLRLYSGVQFATQNTFEVLSFSVASVIYSKFKHNEITDNFEISLKIRTEDILVFANTKFGTIRTIDISISQDSEKFPKLLNILPKMFPTFSFDTMNTLRNVDSSATVDLDVPVDPVVKKMSTNCGLVSNISQFCSSEVIQISDDEDEISKIPERCNDAERRVSQGGRGSRSIADTDLDQNVILNRSITPISFTESLMLSPASRRSGNNAARRVSQAGRGSRPIDDTDLDQNVILNRSVTPISFTESLMLNPTSRSSGNNAERRVSQAGRGSGPIEDTNLDQNMILNRSVTPISITESLMLSPKGSSGRESFSKTKVSTLNDELLKGGKISMPKERPNVKISSCLMSPIINQEKQVDQPVTKKKRKKPQTKNYDQEIIDIACLPDDDTSRTSRIEKWLGKLPVDFLPMIEEQLDTQLSHKRADDVVPEPQSSGGEMPLTQNSGKLPVDVVPMVERQLDTQRSDKRTDHVVPESQSSGDMPPTQNSGKSIPLEEKIELFMRNEKESRTILNGVTVDIPIHSTQNLLEILDSQEQKKDDKFEDNSEMLENQEQKKDDKFEDNSCMADDSDIPLPVLKNKWKRKESSADKKQVSEMRKSDSGNESDIPLSVLKNKSKRKDNSADKKQISEMRKSDLGSESDIPLSVLKNKWKRKDNSADKKQVSEMRKSDLDNEIHDSVETSDMDVMTDIEEYENKKNQTNQRLYNSPKSFIKQRENSTERTSSDLIIVEKDSPQSTFDKNVSTEMMIRKSLDTIIEQSENDNIDDISSQSSFEKNSKLKPRKRKGINVSSQSSSDKDTRTVTTNKKKNQGEDNDSIHDITSQSSSERSAKRKPRKILSQSSSYKDFSTRTVTTNQRKNQDEDNNNNDIVNISSQTSSDEGFSRTVNTNQKKNQDEDNDTIHDISPQSSFEKNAKLKPRKSKKAINVSSHSSSDNFPTNQKKDENINISPQILSDKGFPRTVTTNQNKNQDEDIDSIHDISSQSSLERSAKRKSRKILSQSSSSKDFSTRTVTTNRKNNQDEDNNNNDIFNISSQSLSDKDFSPRIITTNQKKNEDVNSPSQTSSDKSFSRTVTTNKKRNQYEDNDNIHDISSQSSFEKNAKLKPRKSKGINTSSQSSFDKDMRTATTNKRENQDEDNNSNNNNEIFVNKSCHVIIIRQPLLDKYFSPTSITTNQKKDEDVNISPQTSSDKGFSRTVTTNLKKNQDVDYDNIHDISSQFSFEKNAERKISSQSSSDEDFTTRTVTTNKRKNREEDNRNNDILNISLQSDQKKNEDEVNRNDDVNIPSQSSSDKDVFTKIATTNQGKNEDENNRKDDIFDILVQSSSRKDFSTRLITNQRKNEEGNNRNDDNYNISSRSSSDIDLSTGLLITNQRKNKDRGNGNKDVKVLSLSHSASDQNVSRRSAKRKLYNPHDYSYLQRTITEEYLQSENSGYVYPYGLESPKSKNKKRKSKKVEKDTISKNNKSKRAKKTNPLSEMKYAPEPDKTGGCYTEVYRRLFQGVESAKKRKYSDPAGPRKTETYTNKQKRASPVSAAASKPKPNWSKKVNIISDIVVQPALTPSENTDHKCGVCDDTMNRMYLEFIRHMEKCNPESLETDTCQEIINVLQARNK